MINALFQSFGMLAFLRHLVKSCESGCSDIPAAYFISLLLILCIPGLLLFFKVLLAFSVVSPLYK